jgi:hypothetical protein
MDPEVFAWRFHPAIDPTSAYAHDHPISRPIYSTSQHIESFRLEPTNGVFTFSRIVSRLICVLAEEN